MKDYCVYLFIFIVTSISGYDTEVVVLRAVRGRDARLPCGQGRVFLDGPDAYVLWLKNDRDFLHRFPDENSPPSSSERVFGPCEGGACADDTSLLLRRLAEEDAGLYRCRVHYQASPSVDYVIEVRLVDSPGMPKIYKEDGEEIRSSHIGPLSLGSNFTLICEVADDQPDTLVFWRRNGAVVERARAVRAGLLRAEVRRRSVGRDELDARYDCLATNADVTEPLTATIVVKMFLPPLSVEIRVDNNLNFEAGQPRVVDCVVVGCVPPPSISWHLGDTLLRSNVHKELHDGNYTVSSLTLAPGVRDSGRVLSCRAHNSLLPDHTFADNVTLNVGFRPVCVSSGAERVGAVPREPETVTCTVDAAPPPLQLAWTFPDARTLYTSPKKVPGQRHRYSSSLTWVARAADVGALLCRAVNAFGEQARPCTFSLTRGGPPQPPRCDLARAAPDTLSVQCRKGWDGGRAQQVQLVVRDAAGGVLHNSSSRAGHFLVPLRAANVTAELRAASARGASAPTTLTLAAPSPAAAHGVSEWGRAWAVWAQVALGVGAAAAAAAAALWLRARHRPPAPGPDLVPRPAPPATTATTDLPIYSGTFHREPDFAREDRLLGTTNITVNQLASCQNAPPRAACSALLSRRAAAARDTHSYFV